MKMKIASILIGLCFLSVIYSCNNQKLSTVDNLQNIDIEANISNLEVIKLSQFTDNIQYLPLETKDYFVLHRNCRFDFLDSLILVYDLKHCQLFNSNGKFLNTIGSRGRGPAEFQFCIQACFTKSKTIYLQSLYDLYEYRLDGSIVKKYESTFKIENSEENSIYNWGLLNDSSFFGHVPNSTGQIKYKALLKNKQGGIIFSWKNYDQFYRKRFMYGLEKDAYVYFFKGSLFFKQFFNDTLFCLNSEESLIPKYSFYLGNFKIPASLRPNGIGGKELWSHISLNEVFQTENYLFLNCMFGDRFPAKRLTLSSTQMGSSWYNTTVMLGIVDKHSGILKFCKPTSTDNPLFTTGIYNDIDAGPRFFPVQMVNDSTMVMVVDAKELKDHVKSDDFRKSKPKYPEKKEQLAKLADSISEMDNGVLMFVSFKR
jgi:hypothetical protein